MGRNYLLSFVFCVVIFTNSNAQKIATLEVELTKPAYGLDMPVKVDLDTITFLSDTALSLIEIQGNKRTQIPFQIRNGEHRTLHWVIKSGDEKVKKHFYELVKGKTEKNSNYIRAKAEDGLLTIHTGDKNLLGYQYETIYPPDGVDSAYQRSGFIHPLWSPIEQILTRIQPPDHYHHYGIWNPWTQVFFEGDTIDFWNLGKQQDTVRFANFVSISEGPIFCEYQALHEHVVFKKGGKEKVALNELQSVRVYQPGERDYYIADITIEMNCDDKSPLLLLEYRYGGFGWRTTEQWTKDNSEVLTSEGKTRKDADGTRARWCIVQGAVDDDYAGAVMMSYPTNYNHPEPLRIWPENMNDPGDMFANFSPTKNMDWSLEPGQRYVLKYRLIVFNGRFTKEKAESAWQYYAISPKIVVKMN